jgi:hypothetical protein
LEKFEEAKKHLTPELVNKMDQGLYHPLTYTAYTVNNDLIESPYHHYSIVTAILKKKPHAIKREAVLKTNKWRDGRDLNPRPPA